MTQVKPLASSIFPQNIPADLRAIPHWLNWKWEQRPDKSTGELKWTKPPYQPNGSLAKSVDPGTWATFDLALTAYEKGSFSGIGFVLTKDDDFAGVDLDHCVDLESGAIEPWAMKIVHELDSYTEISPSGAGLRIFLYAKLPPKDRKIGNFECYESGRYLTVTGNHLPGTPATIEHRQGEMTAVHTLMFAERNKPRVQPLTIPAPLPVGLDDAALLKIAFGAKNGEAVRRLYEGDASGKGSHSESDLALCSHLAFYAGPDALRVDRLFRASGLMREKWDEPHGALTYGEKTVNKAIEGTTEFYSPPNNANKWTPEASYSEDSVDSVRPWEKPQNFASVVVPEFPADCLPPDLAEYVYRESVSKQVPIDLPGCLVLGAIAAASADKCSVFLADDWEERTNNYFISVLPSGERKSPTFRDVFAPLEAIERDRVMAQKPIIDRATQDHSLLDKRLQHVTALAAKVPIEERNSAEADAREIADELSRIEIPVAPQLLADDCTPEAVAGLLADQGGRIAIVSAEGGIFDIIGGRYSDKGVNLDVYLKGYSGDSLRVNRRSRGLEHVQNPALTIVLTVQPDIINCLAETQAFRNRGLLARFLYSMPGSKVGFRDTNPPSTRPEVRANWRSMLTGIANLPYPTAANPNRPSIYLSADARALFQSYQVEIEAAMRPGGDLDDMQDWANKLNGSVARLAGLLHIAGCIGQTDAPWEIPISRDSMANAIALGEYFRGHAKAAFAAMGADPRIASAKKAWAAITRHKYKEFSVRDLYQNVKGSRFKTVPELEKALGLLVELGYIREIVASKREGPGQPPSQRYEVNPLSYPQNTQNPQNTPPVGVAVVGSEELSTTAGEV